MLGCEIIERAEAGELVLWTRERAERIIRNHRASVDDFTREIAPPWDGNQIAAATVLLWLGY